MLKEKKDQPIVYPYRKKLQRFTKEKKEKMRMRKRKRRRKSHPFYRA